MKKTKYDEAIDRASERIRQLGIERREKLEIYTTLEHVSRSGMMRKVSAFVMVDNMPICIAREVTVNSAGEDSGHKLAHDIFSNIHGLAGEWRYQDHLVHRWM